MWTFYSEGNENSDNRPIRSESSYYENMEVFHITHQEMDSCYKFDAIQVVRYSCIVLLETFTRWRCEDS